MNSSMYRAHGSIFKIAVCDRKNSVSLGGSANIINERCVDFCQHTFFSIKILFGFMSIV